MIKAILYIASAIANFVYFVILRMDLYTDRYHLPDGEMGENRRSPISSLAHADMNGLVTLELFLMVVSVITSLLLLFGVKNNIVKIVQIVSTIASTAVFIIILVIAGNIHLKY